MLLSAAAPARDKVLPSLHSRTARPQLERPKDVPPDAELEGAQARIGEIRIQPRNIFDADRPDENTALFRLANRLHIRTHVSTVKDQLLFQSGDVYQARLLAESERILRGTRYIQDATILPVAYHDGVVDVEAITHDVWTLNPGISFGRTGGKSTSGFKLEELNLLGLGSQISLGRKSGVDRTSTTLRYSDPQLFGSWWTLTAGHSDNSDGKTDELNIEHPFYALDTQRAVGLSGVKDQRVDSLYDLGEVTDQYGVQQRRATLYGGWSSGLRNGWVRRITAGFTYDDSQFMRVVGETGPTTLLPRDRKLSYPWLGYEWIQDDFEKARNRDQIEKTEDVQLGLRAKVQAGYAAASFGSDRNAVVFNAGVSRGFEPGERQRLLLATTLAGRQEGGTLTDTVAGISARYYLRQSNRRLLFLSTVADVGTNLDLDHPLLLGGDNGLRGYPLRYQGGKGRWLMTAEQRYFTNWFPFRLFNVGGAVFYDMGRTWGDNPSGTRSQGMLKDVGFGLRLGNSRSALGNVLHIDLAFPLDGGRSIDKLQFLVETQRSF
ncbi:MAG: hypothetical protein ABI885_02685 [Gammaproteobacteria bacterium]